MFLTGKKGFSAKVFENYLTSDDLPDVFKTQFLIEGQEMQIATSLKDIWCAICQKSHQHEGWVDNHNSVLYRVSSVSAVTIIFSLWFQRDFTGNNTYIPFFLHPFTLQWECCPHPYIGHSSALWNKKKERLYLVSRCVWRVSSLLLLLLRYMGLEMWCILSLCCHCCCCYWGCGSGGGHVEVSWNYNKKIKKRKPI